MQNILTGLGRIARLAMALDMGLLHDIECSVNTGWWRLELSLQCARPDKTVSLIKNDQNRRSMYRLGKEGISNMR
jgi:uncharacterized protein YjhX (UPF0386 family)